MAGFSLDTRSLALARILAGLIVLIDLAYRALFLRAHYTGDGVLPLTMIPGAWRAFPGLHLLSDAFFYQAFLFGIHALFAVALLLGFRTRLVTVVCFYLAMSLEARNPLVLNSGDIMLRLTLFWGMFLPWGDSWSLDSPRSQPYRLLSMPALAWTVQIGLVYPVSVLHKMSSPIWSGGTAIYYAVHLDHVARWPADWLLKIPDLFPVLTALVLVYEALAGILLMLPSPTARMWGVVSCMALHYGLGWVLELGIFRYSPWVALVALLPSQVWDRGQRDLELRNKLGQSVLSLVTLVLISLVLFVNVENVRGAERPMLHRVMGTMGLDQNWNMFVKNGLVADFWELAPAHLSDGSEVDLLDQGRPISWEKPDRASLRFPTQRWLKYLSRAVDNQELVSQLADWLRRDWDATHPDRRVESLRLVRVNEITLPNFQPSPLRFFELYPRYGVEIQPTRPPGFGESPDSPLPRGKLDR